MKQKLKHVILLSLLLFSINLNAQYCNFNVTHIDDEDIISVQIVGANGTFINNQTSCSAPIAPSTSQFNYYGAAATNKEGKVIPPLVLDRGRSYSITVKMGWCGAASYANFIKVWIDYNNNFVFDEPSELVFANSDIRQTNSSMNPGPISYTSAPFTVPFGAKIANTRMRVALYESANATAMPAAFTPCSGATWGEAEDYDLKISGGSTFDIVAFNLSNGSITPTGTTTLSQGSSQRYTFIPNAGYLVDSVIVDGTKVDSLQGYTFSNISANHSIRVTFKVDSNNVSMNFPTGISYQAVARDSAGKVLANSPVKLRFSIIENAINGNTVYAETANLTTNKLGLFTCVIGNNNATYGNYKNLDWMGATKYLQLELEQGNSFVLLGTQQLLSVPYANAANTSNTSNESKKIKNASLPVYPDNNSALQGGLQAGETYRTNAGVLMIVY